MKKAIFCILTAVFSVFSGLSNEFSLNLDKIFNSNLSSEEINVLLSGEVLIRNTKKAEKAALLPLNETADEIINDIINLKPSYLAEIIQIVPVKGNSKILSKIEKIMTDIPSYKGIPYYSERNDVWADLYRIPYRTCPLDENWHIRPEDYKQPNGGVIFPNPNAPTGLLERMEVVEEIIQANRDVVVIVDEAYIDFGGVSALPLLEKYDNLLVVQTFSKSRAMAGLRIGFCIGNEKLIQYLNDVKFSFNSYTMNLPAQVLGVEAVKDDAYFKETTGKIVATREWVKEELTKLGFTFPDSKANFVFASHKSVPAKDIFLSLREADIYVRYWDKPRINNSLRITIGTDEEMRTLIDFLKEYLAER